VFRDNFQLAVHNSQKRQPRLRYFNDALLDFFSNLLCD